jgi:hypothetical protein
MVVTALRRASRLRDASTPRRPPRRYLGNSSRLAVARVNPPIGHECATILLPSILMLLLKFCCHVSSFLALLLSQNLVFGLPLVHLFAAPASLFHLFLSILQLHYQSSHSLHFSSSNLLICLLFSNNLRCFWALHYVTKTPSIVLFEPFDSCRDGLLAKSALNHLLCRIWPESILPSWV